MGAISGIRASKARLSLNKNLKDVENLLALHTFVGGTKKGRRHGLEALNKAAIVLITAFWEAYCEDIAAEALAHIVEHSKTADRLPNELKKQLAKELKTAQHELEVWKIADSGWKKYLSDRLDLLKEKRNRDLNTPKAAQVEELFHRSLGVVKISAGWSWKNMTPSGAAHKLDKYVTLRGVIAHRGSGSQSVKKSDVTNFFKFVGRLAANTGRDVNKHVRMVTEKPLWQR
jgi:hypothetical protein